MDYEERSKEYCKDCKFHKECCWPKQERYANCIDGQNFMSGWELGQKDTLDEIEKILNNASRLTNGRYNSGWLISLPEILKEKIELLKKG